MSDGEDSLIAGLKGATGAILAIFIIFVVAPCTFCGGLAVCGKALEETETGPPPQQAPNPK